jgi:hypothetical protein
MTTTPKLILPEDRKRYEVTLTMLIDAPKEIGTGALLLDVISGLTLSQGTNLERMKEINVEFINEYRK